MLRGYFVEGYFVRGLIWLRGILLKGILLKGILLRAIPLEKRALLGKAQLRLSNVEAGMTKLKKSLFENDKIYQSRRILLAWP